MKKHEIKTSYLVAGGLLLITLIAISACYKKGDNSKNNSNNTKSLTKMEISKKELQQNLEKAAKTAENQINELESEMKNASDDAKKQLQTTLDVVKVQQKIIANKTKEVAEASQDSWESIKTEASKTAN